MSFFEDKSDTQEKTNTQITENNKNNVNNVNNENNLVEVGNFSKTLNNFDLIFTNANNQKKAIYVNDLQNGVSIKT